MSKATHTCSRQYEPASCALLSSHTLSSVQSSQTLHHVVLSVELLSDSPTSVVERISPAPVPSDGEWMGVERWGQELENYLLLEHMLLLQWNTLIWTPTGHDKPSWSVIPETVYKYGH